MIEVHLRLQLAPHPEMLSVSDSIQALLGYEPSHFIGGQVCLFERIHLDDTDIAQLLTAPAASVSSGVVNLRLRQSNGRIRCVRCEYSKWPTTDAEGSLLDLRLQDAKGLPRTLDDAALTLNFRAMMENTDDFIYFKDRNHVFTGASQSLVSLCDPAEHWTDLLGQTDYDVFPEEYADIYYRLEKQVFAGIPVAREVQETRGKDGTPGWVDNRKYPIKNADGDILGLYGIARDITPLKRTEIELLTHRNRLEDEVGARTRALEQALAQIKANEERYDFALQATNDGIWDWNLQNNTSYVNPGYSQMLGYAPGELGTDMQTQFTHLLHPDDRAHVPTQARHLLETVGSYDLEFRLRCKDGNYKWMLSRGKVFERSATGQPLRAVGTHIDLTDRKRLEDMTMAAALYTRSLIEASLDPLVTISPEGKITDVNSATERVTGVNRTQLIDSDFADYFTEPEQARLGYQKVFSDGFVTDYPLAIRSESGQVIDVLYNASVYRDANAQVRGVFAAARDITVQKMALEELEQHRSHLEQLVATRTAELARRLEETTALNQQLEASQNQLLQSEKMASVGQLAAGVAHEINNPVGFVSSNLRTLGGYLQDIFAITDAYEALEAGGSDTCDPLASIRQLKSEKDLGFLKSDTLQLLAECSDGLARVAKIVRDLKTFSRAEQAIYQWADLHAGLDSTLNIVWNELKYKCTVEKAYGPLPQVFCVPGQINQVFLNLLVNAGQAIADKGCITLRTGQQGDQVFVAVTDSGCGISPENLRHIFEPFFTTKPIGQGTGLGLSLSYNIVQKHHGRIEASSEWGKGSTFTLWLPIEAQVDGPSEATAVSEG